MDPDFDDFMFNNKPIQLRTGEWFGPVAIRTGPRQGNPYHEGFYSAGSLVSPDNGSNWKVVSRTPELAASGYGWPDTRVWEPTAFQKDDGTIAMYVRNSWGIIHVTFSRDHGHSWSEFEPTVMVNPCSRFHIRKLPSELGGAVICLDNPVADQSKGAQNRTPLGMYISYDEGDTFTRLVILDPHGLCMYPDADLDPDGHTLHLLYENRKDIFYASMDLREVL